MISSSCASLQPCRPCPPRTRPPPPPSCPPSCPAAPSTRSPHCSRATSCLRLLQNHHSFAFSSPPSSSSSPPSPPPLCACCSPSSLQVLQRTCKAPHQSQRQPWQELALVAPVS